MFEYTDNLAHYIESGFNSYIQGFELHSVDCGLHHALCVFCNATTDSQESIRMSGNTSIDVYETYNVRVCSYCNKEISFRKKNTWSASSKLRTYCNNGSLGSDCADYAIHNSKYGLCYFCDQFIDTRNSFPVFIDIPLGTSTYIEDNIPVCHRCDYFISNNEKVFSNSDSIDTFVCRECHKIAPITKVHFDAMKSLGYENDIMCLNCLCDNHNYRGNKLHHKDECQCGRKYMERLELAVGDTSVKPLGRCSPVCEEFRHVYDLPGNKQLIVYSYDKDVWKYVIVDKTDDSYIGRNSVDFDNSWEPVIEGVLSMYNRNQAKLWS